MKETQPAPKNEVEGPVLDDHDTEILHRLENEELTCPWCEMPLAGQVVATATYQGVGLFCVECNFQEYS